MVMTTSLAWTASVMSTFGAAAARSGSSTLAVDEAGLPQVA